MGLFSGLSRQSRLESHWGTRDCVPQNSAQITKVPCLGSHPAFTPCDDPAASMVSLLFLLHLFRRGLVGLSGERYAVSSAPGSSSKGRTVAWCNEDVLQREVWYG